MPTTESPVDTFVRLTTLRREGSTQVSEPGGASPAGTMFGGMLCAQAVMAASAMTDLPLPHSLHMVFLRPGNVSEPVVYRTEALREGRSFATFRVSGEQAAGRVVDGTVSLTSSRPGPAQQQASSPAGAPPDGLVPLWQAMGSSEPGAIVFHTPGELQTGPLPLQERGDPPNFRFWYELDKRLELNGAVRAAALVHGSDQLSAPLARYFFGRPGSQSSLDHSVWFHGEEMPAGMHILEFESPRAASGRALLLGAMFQSDGALVMSVAQEATFRIPEAGAGQQP